MALFRRSSGVGVGIDLGTSNIVVYQSGKGVVYDEPSCVSVRKLPRGGVEVIAYGHESKAMIGKTPVGVSVIKPLRDGVIANFEMTEAVLRHFISKACRAGHFSNPQVVVSVPAKVTEVERRAVVDAALGAGAREAYILDEPIAAALGAGLPISAPEGSMVLDIGSGTSEVAVISLGGLVVSNSLRAAGDSMDEAIIGLFRQKHALLIGESTAENVKIQIGSVMPLDEELEMEVKGRDLADGLPKVTREQTPPELSRDIVDNGIVLTGGGSLLRGLPRKLTNVLGSPVILAEDPIHAVANGVGMTLQNLGEMKRILTTVHKSQL